MKTLVSVILLIYFSLNACSQNLISYDKQWNEYVGGNSPSYSTFIYKFRNDTLINKHNYSQLYVKSDTSKSAGWNKMDYFLREDSLNRVYIINYLDEDEILYDFNLVKGDTFFPEPGNDYCELLVIDVDTVELLNGEKRKRLKLVEADAPDPNAPWFGSQDWIEGMGSTASLVNYMGKCYTDFNQKVLCHYEKGRVLYTDTLIRQCFYSPVENNKSSDELIIYPNPATKKFSIFNLSTANQNKVEVKLINMQGVVVREWARKDDFYTLEGVIPGVYFIQIIHEGILLRVSKLVIQD